LQRDSYNIFPNIIPIIFNSIIQTIIDKVKYTYESPINQKIHIINNTITWTVRQLVTLLKLTNLIVLLMNYLSLIFKVNILGWIKYYS